MELALLKERELQDVSGSSIHFQNPLFSHNGTDPVDSLMMSAIELVRAYVQAHLIDREALGEAQDKCDPLQALLIQLKRTGKAGTDNARTKNARCGRAPQRQE
jgi:L-rhamnose isomerase